VRSAARSRTSSATCYIESATGVSVGARTGLANLVTGGCFVAMLLFHSAGRRHRRRRSRRRSHALSGDGSALSVVGVLMARSVTAIDWSELTEAVPAFLTIVLMPTTFSIHTDWPRLVSYAGMKLAAGRGRGGALARPRDRFALRLAILAARVTEGRRVTEDNVKCNEKFQES